jgi:hypothetical protein
MTYPIPERITTVPKWLYEPLHETDNLEKKIAEDLTSLTYWSKVDRMINEQVEAKVKNLPKSRSKDAFDALQEETRKEILKVLETDLYARARLLAESSDQSFDHADALKEIMDRVQIRIALTMEEQGLIPYLEIDNIEEYLLSKKVEKIGPKLPGINSEIDFLVLNLIPLLKANGFSEDLILGISENFHKARVAVPYLRNLLDKVVSQSNQIREAMKETEDKEEQELLQQSLHEAMQLEPAFQDTLEELVTEIGLFKRKKGGGGLSVPEFAGRLKQLRSGDSKPTPAIGYQYSGKGGTLLFISVENRAMLNAILNQTSSLVDWHQGEPEDIAKETARILMMKEFELPIGEKIYVGNNGSSERSQVPTEATVVAEGCST